MPMEKILISKCLLGEKVNYLGKDAFCDHPLIKKWLAEGSLSCGSDMIYDGSFSNKKIPGAGTTTALLRKNNIEVFTEAQIEAAENYLKNIELIYTNT